MINYKIKDLKYNENWRYDPEFKIFIDSNILVDGSLNNFRFKSYKKLFDDLFIKSKFIILETNVINIVEAIKILMDKAKVHFFIDEFAHNVNELKHLPEKYRNFINKYYNDIRESYGKLYINKLEKFLNSYRISVIDNVKIIYKDEGISENCQFLLEDDGLLNLFIIYDKRIEYNDFISLATANQLKDNIFITTDNRLADSVKDYRINHSNNFRYVYSLADRGHIEDLLKDLMNWGIIENYKIEDIRQ
ncbi:hypothetical protein YN1_5500 [Nanoarchaeota archaeon]